MILKSVSISTTYFRNETLDMNHHATTEAEAVPVVVLSTKLEIAQHYGNLRTCVDENEERQQQEAEHVVVFVRPHGGQNEEELDEDCTERQDTADDRRNCVSHVPRLQRHRTWNVAGCDRETSSGFPTYVC